MQAIILAAGEGKRMRPLTRTRPKVMLPVANRPILEHLLLELKAAGVYDVVLVVGYRDDVIRVYFGEGEGLGLRIRYVTQRRQLGTADALRSASHLLEDRFLLLNGDAIVGREELMRILQEDGMAIGVKEVENPEDFGVVRITDGRVREILEKPEAPPTNLINAGIYSLTREILEFVEATPLSRRGEYEITDSIQMALDQGVEFKAVDISGWIDMGYPWDLLKANERILNQIDGGKIEGEVEDGAVIKGDVIVGEGSVIRSGSYIIGPVIIGRECTIGPNCFIRPATSIGDRCHIGAAVEVKNSIIMSGTKLPHLNYVGDSVIGEGCNLGAGTKIANLRLDGDEVYLNVNGKKVATGRRKFGAVIGDNVKTGINVTINIGTLIGNDALIAPHTKAEGSIEPYTRVF